MTQFSIRLCVMVSIVCLICACTGNQHSFDWRKPVALDLNPPEGPKPYQQGWLDGCHSGLSSTNNSLHLFLGSYKFTLDQQLRHDALYSAAWRYAYNHCGYSMKSLAQYQL
jgi:hypothetical protein